MIPTIARRAAILSLGLILAACADHGPAQANCFGFRKALQPAERASAITMAAEATDSAPACDFVRLEAGV